MVQINRIKNMFHGRFYLLYKRKIFFITTLPAQPNVFDGRHTLLQQILLLKRSPVRRDQHFHPHRPKKGTIGRGQGIVFRKKYKTVIEREEYPDQLRESSGPGLLVMARKPGKMKCW